MRIVELAEEEYAAALQPFLGRLPFFQGFSAPQRQELSRYFQKLSFKGDEFILRQGQSGNCLYAIASGTVELSVNKPGDVKRVLQLLGPGVLFGEVSMLSRSVVTATARALEDTVCYGLSSDKLEQVRFGNPPLAALVESAIAVGAASRIAATLQQANGLFDLLQAKKSLAENNPALRWFGPMVGAHHQELPDYEFDVPQLLTLEIFHEFTLDELLTLLRYGVVRALQKGCAYDSHPAHRHAVTIILSGTLQVYNDVIPKISIVEPGQMHGELSIVKPDEQILRAVAREESLLIVFDKPSLDRLSAQEPLLWIKFHRIICTQVVMFLYDVDRQLVRLEAESHTL